MSRVAAILAGGASARMGTDKACVRLAGRRLIDIVHERLMRQADRVVISASHDYGLGLGFIPDDARLPKGPVGGVLSVAQWCRAQGIDHFATAPVDAPLLPLDLVPRLSEGATCAVARNADGLHPTFAWWSVAALDAVRIDPGSASLKSLCAASGARIVDWEDPSCFSNVNTPQDLAAARSLKSKSGPSDPRSR